MQLVINDVPVNIVEQDGKGLVTSLDVAKVFGKNHQHILEKIKNMSERVLSNFRPISYKDAYNRNQKAYEMNRDGFLFLVMGFTGEKADNWKLDFIEAFNKMEERLLQQPQDQIELITTTLNAVVKQQEIMLTMLNAQIELQQAIKSDVLVKPKKFKPDRSGFGRFCLPLQPTKEKFLNGVIKFLSKNKGAMQGEVLNAVGMTRDNKTGRDWLKEFAGVHFVAIFGLRDNKSYSYFLLKDVEAGVVK